MVVIAGLDPAISRDTHDRVGVAPDGRIKSGHDDMGTDVVYPTPFHVVSHETESIIASEAWRSLLLHAGGGMDRHAALRLAMTVA